MTREEAIELMKEGKRVSHCNFTQYEYLEITGGRIMTEDGYYFGDVLAETGWMANGWNEYKGPAYDPSR